MFFSIFFTTFVLAKELDIDYFFEEIANAESMMKTNPKEWKKRYGSVNNDIRSITTTRGTGRESYYIKDLGLVIEKIIKKNNAEERCNSAITMNHPNIAKTFLYIETLRDNVPEYYLIKAHYEELMHIGHHAEDCKKHEHLEQLAAGLKYLHDNNIALSNDCDLTFTRSTKYNKTINEKQLQFIKDTYITLDEKKGEDLGKTWKNSKTVLIIQGVKKNEDLLKNPITVKDSLKAKGIKTYVLSSFTCASIRKDYNKEAYNDRGELCTHLTFAEENITKNGSTKATDCYLFGMCIGKMLKDYDFKVYGCVYKEDKTSAVINRDMLKDSKDPVDRLIYDCTKLNPNERPDIDKITKSLVTAKVKSQLRMSTRKRPYTA